MHEESRTLGELYRRSMEVEGSGKELSLCILPALTWWNCGRNHGNPISMASRRTRICVSHCQFEFHDRNHKTKGTGYRMDKLVVFFRHFVINSYWVRYHVRVHWAFDIYLKNIYQIFGRHFHLKDGNCKPPLTHLVHGNAWTDAAHGRVSVDSPCMIG